MKKKILIEHGCPIFDKLSKHFKQKILSTKNILIAPSWNKKDELIDLNLEFNSRTCSKNHNITIRSHPMTVRRKMIKLEFKLKFKNMFNLIQKWKIKMTVFK